MIDWGTEAENRYDLKITAVRRGRGAWVFETEQGLKLLKEYKGSEKRLEFEEAVLAAVLGAGSLRVDQYLRNKEDGLVSVAEDGTRYLVKDWFSDRECDIRDKQEILSAARQIAVLHKLLRSVSPREEWNMKSMFSQPLYEEMERHNRELKKARNFIRGKRKKSEFELKAMELFPEFYSQALEAKNGMEELFLREGETILSRYYVCHGELNQHHILMGGGYVAVTEFNKMHLGLQAEDLCHFMRKVMEKNDWDPGLGFGMLEAYERVLPLDETERKCLYYQFLYPEKYWKQINFYYNANKAWIPAKNAEKLAGIQAQQERREQFIRGIR